MSSPTEQWSGEFGNAYIDRQSLSVDSRRAMFARILLNLDPLPASVIEFGANVGDNLVAIRQILPEAITIAVEPNRRACWELARNPAVTLALPRSMTDRGDFGSHDLAFTRGVLIHIPPHELPIAYEALYRAAGRYLLLAEYFSTQPTEIEYRGQLGLLWKRDFAGELMDRYPDLKLRDYGFVYHRDPVAPQDDLTWWLMEKA